MRETPNRKSHRREATQAPRPSDSKKSGTRRPENDIDTLFQDIPLNTFMDLVHAKQLVIDRLHLTQGIVDYLFPEDTDPKIRVEFIAGADFFEPDRIDGKRVYILHGNNHPVAFYQTELGVEYDLISNLRW